MAEYKSPIEKFSVAAPPPARPEASGDMTVPDDYNEADMGGKDAAKAAEVAFKTGLTSLAAALAPPAYEGARAVGRKMGDALGVFSEPERVAVGKIAAALKAGSMTPAQARAKIIAAVPKALSLIDVSPPMAELGRDVAQVPGPARAQAVETLKNRQFGTNSEPGQVERVLKDVETLISPNTDFYGTAKSLSDARRAAAEPSYKAAMDAGADFTPAIRAVMNKPTGQKAWAHAMEIAGDEGVDLDGIRAALEKSKFANRKDTMKLLHYFKQGVDRAKEGAMTEDMFGDPKNTTESYRIDKSVRQPLVAELRRTNPEYAAAMDQFSSHSDGMDALAQGRKFITNDAEVTARDLKAMSPGDREFFRVGAARGIKDIVTKTPDGADVVKRIFGSPQKRRVLEQVFGDPALYKEFEERMKTESGMFDTAKNILGGSQTAEKLAASGANRIDDPFLAKLFHPDVRSSVMAAANVATGNPVMGAARMLAPAMARMRGMRPDVRTELGSRMFDPTRATGTLREIERSGRAAAQRAAVLRRLVPITGMMGAGAGAAWALSGSGEEPESQE